MLSSSRDQDQCCQDLHCPCSLTASANPLNDNGTGDTLLMTYPVWSRCRVALLHSGTSPHAPNNTAMAQFTSLSITSIFILPLPCIIPWLSRDERSQERSRAMVQALLCQMSPCTCCAVLCNAPRLFITLSFCFRVEMLAYTLPFPIILCTTWHNKTLCGRSPGATVTLYAPYTFWRNHRGINTAVFSLLLQCMNNHRKKFAFIQQCVGMFKI